MLFETIFGPDIESIYYYLADKGTTVSITEIRNLFVPRSISANAKSKLQNPKNVNDAISFLKSAGLIEGNKILSAKQLQYNDFKLSLLHALRKIETNEDLKVLDELDRYYLHILTKLFIEANKFYLSLDQLHKQVNSIKGVPKAVNKTKIGAWKRVMEYLGLGFRDNQGGFYCVYNDSIIRKIVFSWSNKSGAIQNLMEEHFDKFLPWRDHKGKMSNICMMAFKRLQNSNIIKLLPKQDLAVISYFDRKYKGIEVVSHGY